MLLFWVNYPKSPFFFKSGFNFFSPISYHLLDLVLTCYTLINANTILTEIPTLVIVTSPHTSSWSYINHLYFILQRSSIIISFSSIHAPPNIQISPSKIPFTEASVSFTHVHSYNALDKATTINYSSPSCAISIITPPKFIYKLNTQVSCYYPYIWPSHLPSWNPTIPSIKDHRPILANTIPTLHYKPIDRILQAPSVKWVNVTMTTSYYQFYLLTITKKINPDRDWYVSNLQKKRKTDE